MEYATDYCAEIGIRYNANISEERISIKSSIDVVSVMNRVENFQDNIEYKEMFYALYLNTANKLISAMRISEGGVSQSIVDTRFIMQGAIQQNASAMVVVHNHPSGKTNPSAEDVSITQKIKKCCELFNIRLLDHIIVSKSNYYSFAEQTMLA